MRLLFLILAALLIAPHNAVADPVWPQAYHLQAGDELQVHVYGEDDLTGAYRLTPEGALPLPLAGPVTVAGKTLADATVAVAAALADGYLKNPQVSLEMAAYRPVYIMGAVTRPGAYEYREGLSLLQAVAAAGGYSTGAVQGEAAVTRRCGPDEVTAHVPVAETLILPGDVIRIAHHADGRAQQSRRDRGRTYR